LGFDPPGKPLIPQFYLFLGVAVLLMSLGRRVVRRHNTKPHDWALVVAFVRLDFPPHQRDLAQKIAVGLAAIVGMKIKQLRHEHTLKQIAAWSPDDHIHTRDLIKIFLVAFGVACDENTTFRTLVEKVSAKQANDSQRAAKA
jgi:hypothetical protein